MDGDADRGGEDRRRDFHTLLSIEFLVTNGFCPAPKARQQTTYKNTDMKILICSTHANTHTYTQAGRDILICCLVLYTFFKF